ncbi:hypothetical protein [Streptomyces lincolnensis]|uniref:hypothetical protein n=1 Tax=Streptomyces lincolnensis TaxID=1915 RepID=UPI00082FE2C2|nr:hypothetical protein [Streptomyces lincolnensis]QMV09207.1 hypothetical protein GJU35_28555 [Streptomyces lincolnensis]
MKRSSRARTGAAVSVLALALITGCGGGSDDKDASEGSDKGAGKGSSASPATAAKALGAAELEKLLLAQGDVKGYKVASGDDTLPKSKSDVKADKAACAPLAYAMAGLAPGETDASVSNTVTKDPSSDAASKAPEDLTEADIENAFKVEMTFVGLSSYEGDGAAKAVKAVSDGVAACSGGFGITAQGEQQKLTKVTAGKASGKGDESVAFSVNSDMDGTGTATFNTEVVRVGSTVTTYYTVDFASVGTGKAAAVPTAVIDAQLAKLK